MSQNYFDNESIAQTLSKVLEVDICITDASLNLLANSSELVLNKDSLKLVSGSRKTMYRAGLHQEFVEVTDGIIYTELVIPVLDFEHSIMGYLMMSSAHPKVYQEDMVKICLPAVEKYLLYDIIKRKSDYYMESILVDVLQGNLRDTDAIKKKLVTNHFVIKKNVQFLFLETYKLGENMSHNRLISLIRSVWDVVYFLHSQSNLIVLITSDGEIVNENSRKKLKLILEEYRIFGGFSEVFHKIDHYLGYYLCRAVCAAKAAERLDAEDKSACYEDVISIALLYSDQMPYGIRKCCDPRFIELMEQDKLNKTEYLNTLLTFWKHKTDREKSSRILNIHKNTLGYRLHYIEEMFEINVYDPQIIISFYASAQMLKALNELDFQL